MDTIKYKVNDNEFGYFIVNTELNSIISLDKNSPEYIEYNNWISSGNTLGIWQINGIKEESV